MHRRFIVAMSVALGGALGGDLRAENWPQWRGPRLDGVSTVSTAPTRWSKSSGIAWRLPLPGQAGSTPIAWGDRIFLTSAADSNLVLICVDIHGKDLWQRKVTQGNRVVRGGEGNSASASPCTDGKHVWAFFGDGVMACFDFDGNEVWRFGFQERFGKFRIQFGMTSTPLLDGDRIYQQVMTSNGAYVVCLEKATGKTIWKVDRKSDAEAECEHSYASVQRYRDDKHDLLLSHGADYIIAHRPSDGSEVWRCGGLNPRGNYNATLRLIASPACAPGMIVVPSAKNGPILALKPDGQGDISERAEFKHWTRRDKTPDVPSPLIQGGLVYLCRENGVLMCLDAKSGELVYEKSVHRQRHRASPLLAGGNIYLCAADGLVNVVAAGREYKLLATNDMEEPIASSPIMANGMLLLRTFDALYAVRAADSPAAGN